MMRTAQLSLQRQRGASLLVALAFLVIMAMLGVTVANVTTLQERMAGNTRDRELALQAAEAALRDAEERLADSTFRAGVAYVDATLGNDDAFWMTCFGGTAPPCATKYNPTNALPESGNGSVAEPPEYVVERKPDIGTTQIYRVTAKGYGGTEDAVVILQAEFGI
jgi:type IV pilus assembly protein PilX